MVSHGHLGKPSSPFLATVIVYFLYFPELRFDKHLPSKLIKKIDISLLLIMGVNGDFKHFVNFFYTLPVDHKDTLFFLFLYHPISLYWITSGINSHNFVVALFIAKPICASYLMTYAIPHVVDS